MAYKRSEVTKERLIRSGEWLFARRGIAGVSAREVAKHAKISNNFAVAYHFGSMDELIRSIVRDRVLQIDSIRLAMFSKSQNDGEDSIQILLECLLHPHIGARDSDGFHAFAAILCQYLPKYYPKGFPWRQEQIENLTPGFDRIIEGLRKGLPDLPVDIFDRRLTNASLLFFNVLVGLSQEDSLEELGSDHPIIKDAIRQSTSVLTTIWPK